MENTQCRHLASTCTNMHMHECPFWCPHTCNNGHSSHAQMYKERTPHNYFVIIYVLLSFKMLKHLKMGGNAHFTIFISDYIHAIHID